jgi:maleate isomerase
MIRRPALGAPYGWRARIGFMQSSAGIDNHPFEFYLMAPEGVQLVMISLRGLADQQDESTLSADSLNQAVERIPAGLRELLKHDVDVIVQPGVPHITIQGWGFEEKLRAEVSSLTTVPFVMDTRACIDAMQRLQMSRIAFVSPFPEAMSEGVVEYMRHAGIEIVANRRVQTRQFSDMRRVPLAIPYRAAKDAYAAAPNADGVWIAGAAMPSVAAIEPLEQDLGVPVISSKQAMVWAALKAARVSAPISGYGRLFDIP